MGNNSGCVSAPMDDDERPRTNMDKFSAANMSMQSLSASASASASNSSHSLSFSSSTVMDPHPHSDEDHEYSSHSDHDSVHEEVFKTNLKILFLDVDGVLNNPHTRWGDQCGIDDEMLKYLKFIVVRTGCKIVLSTTWRLSEDAKTVLLHTLKVRGDMNPDDLVIGQTPSLKKQGGHRTHEIAEYLRANAYRFNVVSWCAVDDLSLHKYDDFSRHFMDGHFVRTDKMLGMTPENMMQCISALNANDNEYNSYKSHHRARSHRRY